MTAPLPYSQAWWLQQPPRPLAETVRLFQAKKDTLSPAVRRSLEKRLPPLDVAEQIDRDMNRIFRRERG